MSDFASQFRVRLSNAIRKWHLDGQCCPPVQGGSHPGPVATIEPNGLIDLARFDTLLMVDHLRGFPRIRTRLSPGHHHHLYQLDFAPKVPRAKGGQ